MHWKIIQWKLRKTTSEGKLKALILFQKFERFFGVRGIKELTMVGKQISIIYGKGKGTHIIHIIDYNRINSTLNMKIV